MTTLILFLCFVFCVNYCSVVSTRIYEQTTSLPPMFGGRIKHVIAIMFENRSFDHMLGYLRSSDTDIDGCIPSLGKQCSNPINPENTNENNAVYVSNDAVYIQPGDPGHSIADTSQQVYGSYAENGANWYPPPMNGFIKSYSTREQLNDNGSFVMRCFNESTLPILYTLAKEFAVIDHWFADVPGPTEPNRIFAFMGTSQGMAVNYHPKLAEGFFGNNIFKMIDDFAPNNMSNTPPQKWRTYFQDVPSSGFLNYVRLHFEHGRPLLSLFDNIANGELPLFSWIDPQYYDSIIKLATDQHPDHDVREGEKLLKMIYEHLRASRFWNDTLLVVYYDEHGGFFDHVPPPNCPNPDGKNSTHITPSFAFNRLGVRVPAILISPWIRKGTVGKHPSHNESQYCHSSLIHTLREQFAPESPSLSKREEWSLTFEDLINLDEMRTDCPLTLPEIPVSAENYSSEWIPGQQALNSYQISFAKMAACMCNRDDELDSHLQNQESMGSFVKQCIQEWMTNGIVMDTLSPKC